MLGLGRSRTVWEGPSAAPSPCDALPTDAAFAVAQVRSTGVAPQDSLPGLWPQTQGPPAQPLPSRPRITHGRGSTADSRGPACTAGLLGLGTTCATFCSSLPSLVSAKEHLDQLPAGLALATQGLQPPEGRSRGLRAIGKDGRAMQGRHSPQRLTAPESPPHKDQGAFALPRALLPQQTRHLGATRHHSPDEPTRAASGLLGTPPRPSTHEHWGLASVDAFFVISRLVVLKAEQPTHIT